MTCAATLTLNPSSLPTNFCFVAGSLLVARFPRFRCLVPGSWGFSSSLTARCYRFIRFYFPFSLQPAQQVLESRPVPLLSLSTVELLTTQSYHTSVVAVDALRARTLFAPRPTKGLPRATRKAGPNHSERLALNEVKDPTPCPPTPCPSPSSPIPSFSLELFNFSTLQLPVPTSSRHGSQATGHSLCSRHSSLATRHFPAWPSASSNPFPFTNLQKQGVYPPGALHETRHHI